MANHKPDKFAEAARDDAPDLTSKDTGEVRAGTAALGLDGDSVSTRSVTINRSRDELFAYWRDFTNLPSFMDNIERVDVSDANHSHWVVKAPGGRTVEWDAIISDEHAPAYFAWTSAKGADVPNSGRIEFAEAGPRGTIVTATIAYDPPAGAIGKLVAKLFQREPAIQARRDLRRFKQVMETGEVATNARNPAQLAEDKD